MAKKEKITIIVLFQTIWTWVYENLKKKKEKHLICQYNGVFRFTVDLLVGKPHNLLETEYRFFGKNLFYALPYFLTRDFEEWTNVLFFIYLIVNQRRMEWAKPDWNELS